MTRMSVLLLGLTVGCSSSDTLTCDVAERTGTYRLEAKEVSGNCGPVATSLVDTTASGSQCQTLSESVSEAGCKLDRTVSCTMADQTFRVVSATRQTTDDASRIEGTQTVTVLGRGECQSTYDVVMTRQ